MTIKIHYVVKLGGAQVYVASTLEEAREFAAGEVTIDELTQEWDETAENLEEINMTVIETPVELEP